MRIVLATDGSACAAEARRFLDALPLPEGSAVRVLSVITQPILPAAGTDAGAYVGWETLEEVYRTEERRARDAIRRDGEGAVGAQPLIRRGEPAREILQEEEEFGAELIIVGSKGLTGLDAFLLGSVARNVAKHAHC